MATSETVDAKKPSSFSSYSEDDEEDEEENIVIYYLEKSKPMTLAEAEMLRDAKKVSPADAKSQKRLHEMDVRIYSYISMY